MNINKGSKNYLQHKFDNKSLIYWLFVESTKSNSKIVQKNKPSYNFQQSPIKYPIK